MGRRLQSTMNATLTRNSRMMEYRTLGARGNTLVLALQLLHQMPFDIYKIDYITALTRGCLIIVIFMLIYTHYAQTIISIRTVLVCTSTSAIYLWTTSSELSTKVVLWWIQFSQGRTQPVKYLWWQYAPRQESTNKWKKNSLRPSGAYMRQ